MKDRDSKAKEAKAKKERAGVRRLTTALACEEDIRGTTSDGLRFSPPRIRIYPSRYFRNCLIPPAGNPFIAFWIFFPPFFGFRSGFRFVFVFDEDDDEEDVEDDEEPSGTRLTLANGSTSFWA